MRGGSAVRLPLNNFFFSILPYPTLRPNPSFILRRNISHRPQSSPSATKLTRPTSRQAHGGPPPPKPDNTSTYTRIRSHPKFIPAAILFTLVIDAAFVLIIYNTGGLEDSRWSPFNDPVLGSRVAWLFRRPAKQALHPNEFKTFVLVDKEYISETSSILTLRPAYAGGVQDAKEDPYAEFWQKGVWSVEIKQPQLQIARRYTPLPNLPHTTIEPTDPEGNRQPSRTLTLPQSANSPSSSTRDLTLLIRRDPTGEVSNYLHRLPLGGKLDIRGGYTEYELPNDILEVLFLAGGTGVAPAMQVAHTLASRYVHKDNGGVGMRLLWANRNRAECVGGIDRDFVDVSPQNPPLKPAAPKTGAASTPPNALVRQLSSLEESGICLRLSTSYFVDTEGTYITPLSISAALASLSTPSGELPVRPQGRKLILISGPEGFVEYLAGPRRFWNGVEATGVTGGVLKGMDLTGWEVRKL